MSEVRRPGNACALVSSSNDARAHVASSSNAHERCSLLCFLHSVPSCAQTMARLWAGVFWVVFAIAMVANGLVNAGIIGQLTIAEISATHPVYLTPPGFAFQVWILSTLRAHHHKLASPQALRAIFARSNRPGSPLHQSTRSDTRSPRLPGSLCLDCRVGRRPKSAGKHCRSFI